MNKRKQNASVLFIICFILFIGTSLWGEVILTSYTGKVEVQPPGASWQGVQNGMALPLGTMISTGFNSTASLDLGASVIHVQQFTRMLVKDLVQRGDVITTDLQLNVGKIRAQVETSEALTHDFNVLSTVSVASVRGTDFEYDGVSLFCHKGEVLFFNLIEQKRTVRTGEEVRLAADETPLSPAETILRYMDVEVTPSPSPDIPADEPDIILPDFGGDAEVDVGILWPEY